MSGQDHASETELLLRLRETLRSYIVAQSRMLDNWSEGDEAVKRTLWRNLHELEHGARELLDVADGRGQR